MDIPSQVLKHHSSFPAVAKILLEVLGEIQKILVYSHILWLHDDEQHIVCHTLNLRNANLHYCKVIHVLAESLGSTTIKGNLFSDLGVVIYFSN